MNPPKNFFFINGKLDTLSCSLIVGAIPFLVALPNKRFDQLLYC